MTDNDFLKLETALLRAGREMEFPATPAIATRVHADLIAGGEPAARAEGGMRGEAQARQWWRVWVPLAAAVLLALALLLVSPTAREAVGQFLGLRGLRIFYVTPTPTATAAPTVTARLTEAAVGVLGTATRTVTVTPQPTRTPTGLPNTVCCEMTLAEAQRKASFKLLVPSDETPSKVYFQPFGGVAGQVVMVFGHPENPRYVLYQAQALMYGKMTGKLLDGEGETLLSETQVNGGRALWFSGAPHIVLRLDADGNPNFETQRTVNANTLAWEGSGGEGDLLYRLETKGTLEQAVRIAESLTVTP